MKIVVIPATYNERENIEKFITVLEEEVFPKIKNHNLSILVADDNSPDGTGDVVKSLMKKYKNLGINEGPKNGLGAAYLRSMGYAIEELGADIVISIDADFQFDPHDLPKFVEKIDKGYDMVVQTRYSNGGSIPENWPIQRKLFSRCANLFVRSTFMRFYLHDWTGGFRAIRKNVFLAVREQMHGYNGYIFQIAFLYEAVKHGFKIGEVPLHFSDRKLGNSKIAPLGYILDVLTFVITARIKELERFIKFLIVGGTGFFVQLAVQEFSARIVFSFVQPPSFRDGLAAGVGAEAAILANFFLNNAWTFGDTKHIKESSNAFAKLVKFNVTSLFAIVIQFASVFIFVHFFGETMDIGGFSIATRIVVLVPTILILVVPINYVIYNKFIWKTQYLKNGKTASK